MDYAFEIFPKERLIIESFSGNLTRDVMFEAFKSVWNHPDYDRSFNGLSDLGDAHFSMTLNEFREMEDDMHVHPLKCQGRWAWISDTPSATAYGILHEKAAKRSFRFSVFSEWTNGFRWVNQEFSPQLVEQVRQKRLALAGKRS